MRKILGIDPALINTGWAIICTHNGQKFEYIASGTIKNKLTASDPIADRLLYTAAAIREIILKYNPEESAIEETFVNSNSVTSLKLGMARGAAILTLAQNNLPVTEYSPTFIKKTIVGNGRADKSQILYMIKVLLGASLTAEKFSTMDESDAIAIALTHGFLSKKRYQ